MKVYGLVGIYTKMSDRDGCEICDGETIADTLYASKESAIQALINEETIMKLFCPSAEITGFHYCLGEWPSVVFSEMNEPDDTGYMPGDYEWLVAIQEFDLEI